jgi:hypothetical protein
VFINARQFSLPRLSESCRLGIRFDKEALIALFRTNPHLVEIPAARDVIDTLFPAVDVTLYRTVWSIFANQPLPASPIPRRYKLATPNTQASIARYTFIANVVHRIAPVRKRPAFEDHSSVQINFTRTADRNDAAVSVLFVPNTYYIPIADHVL